MAQRAAFDSHAEDYETHVMNVLKVSGDSKEFFARGRLEKNFARWDPKFRAVFAIFVAKAPALVRQAKNNQKGKVVLRWPKCWPLIYH